MRQSCPRRTSIDEVLAAYRTRGSEPRNSRDRATEPRMCLILNASRRTAPLFGVTLHQFRSTDNLTRRLSANILQDSQPISALIARYSHDKLADPSPRNA